MTAIDDFVSAAQAFIGAVAAMATDPSDTLRLLTRMAEISPVSASGSDPIGLAMDGMSSACVDLFRRTALISLAQAAANYQPSSATDAYNVMDMVTALLDAEIEIAADQFDDDVFMALKALRTAVVQDLVARGANLAAIVTFTTEGPVPAIVLANRIYGDPSRAEQLIQQVEPIHPLFMPTTFDALSR